MVGSSHPAATPHPCRHPLSPSSQVSRGRGARQVPAPGPRSRQVLCTHAAVGPGARPRARPGAPGREARQPAGGWGHGAPEAGRFRAGQVRGEVRGWEGGAGWLDGFGAGVTRRCSGCCGQGSAVAGVICTIFLFLVKRRPCCVRVWHACTFGVLECLQLRMHV